MYPKATYVHCHAHRWNLSICSCVFWTKYQKHGDRILPFRFLTRPRKRANFVEAVRERTVIKILLSNERNDDVVRDALYDTAWEIANKHDVPNEKTRIVWRQRNRLNSPACSVSEYMYCKRSVYFPFVDHLMVELEDRLVVPKGRFAGQSLISSSLQEITIERQRDILEEYEMLIPEPQHFYIEVRRWQTTWGMESESIKPNDLPST